MKVVAVMTDLFFSVRINEAAKALGMTVQFVKDRDAVLAAEKTKPVVMIFDLNCAAVDAVELIGLVKDAVPTIGFVSHVQVELKQRALEAGCDVVVARSAFSQKLPELLRTYAAAQID